MVTFPITANTRAMNNIALYIVCISACGCVRTSKSDQDTAEKRIDEIVLGEKYELREGDGKHIITGPDEVLQFIRNETFSERQQLNRFLNSDRKGVRYFAVIALSQIGDELSRVLIRRRAYGGEEKDQTLRIAMAVRLMWMNDFSMAGEIEKANPEDLFQLCQIFGMARSKMGLYDIYVSKDRNENEKSLRRIVAMIQSVPKEFIRILR